MQRFQWKGGAAGVDAIGALDFRQLIDGLADLHMLIDLQGNVLYGNDVFHAFSGTTRQDATLPNVYDGVESDAVATLRWHFDELLAKAATVSHRRNRGLAVDSSGNQVWFEFTDQLVFDGDEPVAMFCVGRDVTDRVQAEETIRELASLDPLTGVLNRRSVTATLSRAVAKSVDVAVLFCDVDGLKQLNDTEGHAAGDQVLKRVGHALGQIVRADDAVGRFGGDEFLVIVCGNEAATSAQIANSVLKRLAAAIAADTDLPPISVGYACHNGSESTDELIARADARMYEMKRSRRNETTSSR